MDSASSTYQQLDEEWQALISQAEAEPWGGGWPAFIDMEQSFAWIQERTVSAMRAVEIYNCSFDNAVPGACDFMLGGIGKRELVDACVGGVEGLMFGRANGQGDLDNVPSSAWVDSRLTIEETGYVLGPLKTYERHRTRWSGLRVATARLMELWPIEPREDRNNQGVTVNFIASEPPTKKRPTKRHLYLFKFFAFMEEGLQRKNAQLQYKSWLKLHYPHEQAFGRTTFEQMLECYKDGWTIEDKEWASKYL